ncbi:peptidylprolyl isomerase [Candidatus Palauibacter sp.]|uniref:peptidylprolyl isomerase n=1 Tax=Candidatus Palauibacter sp. TaxID=3101350 RepID=UPI003B5CDE0F
MTGAGRAARFLAATLILVGCERVEPVPSSDVGPDAIAIRPAIEAGPVEVAVETSQGEFVIAVHREWAPVGAERFLDLAESGYYDDARFHRVVPDFIVQWGLAGDPALTAEWMNAYIPDDPVVASNTRGRIAFAFTDPGTRATQVYINLVDNVRLDSTGFAPFGEVVSGMDVVDALYSGYGENSGGGLRRGDQSRIVVEGNAYLDREYPDLDRLIRAVGR